MARLYENPEYYDIAFSYREFAGEVGVFEEAIARHSRIPVRRMLELGCGPAPHLGEIARRGYEYTGLDLSPQMLEYARRRAESIGAKAAFRLGDMVQFDLDEQVDFAFVLLGSIMAQNAAELSSHFDSVGRALRSGGLYFLDWCIVFPPFAPNAQTWEIERGGIKVKATYRASLSSPDHLLEESLELEAQEGGERKSFREVWTRRAIYPGEFLSFVADRKDFEFVGWWNNWDLAHPLDPEGVISRPIAVLRKN